MFFNRQRRPPRRPLLIAERFVSPVARLSGLDLPLDVVASRASSRLRFVLLPEAGGTEGEVDERAMILSNPGLHPEESLRLEFAPFEAPAGTAFLLGVLDLSGSEEIGEAWAEIANDRQALRAAAAGRPPIVLACRGESSVPNLLTDERGMTAFRTGVTTSASGLRVAHGLDAFWCDAHGLFLRGWVTAYEHRVQALRIESAGRSSRVDTFTGRADPRQAGFAVYLACPPGHPVSLMLETDAGPAGFPLPLPEGPLPRWPEESDSGGGLGVSPMLRRFVDFANSHGERGARVLQIGARTPAGLAGMPPRPLLRGPVVGLDIHPGFRVDLVGDAHFLSRFVRPGSFDAVVSGSVLEHLQAPWLFAAEVNRVLKIGGLAYHIVPGAWPAHAQPNDFWRMSADGLRALFGPECGFEVLDARDSDPAALMPGLAWRHLHLDMPTLPTFTMAEILVRKVAEIPAGAVAWPLRTEVSAERSRQYPVAGLRVAPAAREGPP
jgi:SAM-dependent methyltransferase